MWTYVHKKSIKFFQDKGYRFVYWQDYDYTELEHVLIRKKGKGDRSATYADIIIMADTETSKKDRIRLAEKSAYHNHVCIWSIALRAYGQNICCLWGYRPSDFVEMLKCIRHNIHSDEIYIYFHNLAYDWCFLRKFLIEKFGKPTNQLNTKPLYPITIRFQNGIILKDSLILAQRSIEKWGNDLNVDHKKAVGKWDYDLIRNFGEWSPNDSELLYIQNDVLCGVECIDATMQVLKCKIGTIPLTATGIVRSECRSVGTKHKAYDWFLKISPDTYAEQELFEVAFHGGYVHANKWVKGVIFPGYYDMVSPYPICFDFSSSYPFCMLAYKFPSEKFWVPNFHVDKNYILKYHEKYAFLFKLTMSNVRLKDPRFPMPPIAYSKCIQCVNPDNDNGRIAKCDYLETYITEMDLIEICEYYDGEIEISDVRISKKDYLPRWLTDYVYDRYKNKTMLKGSGDPVLYQIEKAKVNSVFGMCAQKPVKIDIVENYDTGEYRPKEGFSFDDEYEKHLKSRNSFLPYCVGVWVTAYAQHNLFALGKCVPDHEIWLYSDTDSVYATAFDEIMIKQYNDNVIKLLSDRGYAGIEHKGKIYYPGIAEFDGQYSQFVTLHSKCYCKRELTALGDGFSMAGDLKITVAGVPKRGAKSLQNNIYKFKSGFIFDGKTSGKLQHAYYYIDDIYIDEHGNETGDSIDLTDCDYILDAKSDLSALLTEEILVNDYEQMCLEVDYGYILRY